MRYIVSLLFVLIITTQINFAQTANELKQLTALENSCKIYSDSENYQALLIDAKKGYQLSNAFHQNKSLNKFVNYIASCYNIFNNADSFKYYSYQTLASAFLIHSEENIVRAQGNPEDLYYSLGTVDSVKKYQQEMINETKTFKDSDVIITLYRDVADVYNYYNEYEKCLTIYETVLHYYEHHKDNDDIAISLVNMGDNYLQMSKSDKALPYLLRALPLLYNYQHGQVVCAQNIGAAYANLNKNDSAIFYFKFGEHVAEKIKDTAGIYTAYENIAAALINEKKYNDAEYYLKPAIQYFKSTDELKGLVDAEEFMGQVEAGRKNFKPAISYFSEALDKAKSANYSERINEIYKRLAQTADSAGLYKEATGYYKSYITSNDSLIKESSKKDIAELETKYKTAQKQQEIDLLNQKEKTQELNLKSQRNTTIFIISAIVFASVLITVYIRYRNRLNQLKKLNEVRNTISRDLHDEIGATLSSINIYSEVAKNKLNDNDDVRLLLQRINDGSLKMMESMSDIVWYVNPKNDIAANTIIRMREYAAPVLEAKQINLEFNADDKVSAIKFSMQQRQHLYLLFKEAINNIAKYANANNAIVTIKCVNEIISLSIADDGKGFDLNNHKSGNGLLNMQQRTEFLKGKCSIKTQPGTGTNININFPVSL